MVWKWELLLVKNFGTYRPGGKLVCLSLVNFIGLLLN